MPARSSLSLFSSPFYPNFPTTSLKLPQANTTPKAYNSIFNDSPPESTTIIGNFPLLPLRTKVRGPAYTLPASSLPANQSPAPDDESYDALDEVLSLFRANTFFRNFEIQGPADRLLIYGILWVSECLGKVRPNHGAREAQKEVQNIALDSNFAIPGDPGFPLNQVLLSSFPLDNLFLFFYASILTLADVQSPHNAPRSRDPPPISHAGTTRAGKQITGAIIRGRGRQAE
jgi:hypothetical protein